jgi:hypothetical protein
VGKDPLTDGSTENPPTETENDQVATLFIGLIIINLLILFYKLCLFIAVFLMQTVLST